MSVPHVPHVRRSVHLLVQSELQQQADGLFVRYLPARLLEGMNIVDTPGTNVILERQQRLTEEYVPRADLVLFTISADRPFSGSEVSEQVARGRWQVAASQQRLDTAWHELDLRGRSCWIRCMAGGFAWQEAWLVYFHLAGCGRASYYCACEHLLPT